VIDEGCLSEVIVVNDGSDDRTSEIAHGFVSEHPCMKVIDISENTGKGNALAEGVVLAGGDIVLFLDADLVNLNSDAIRTIVTPLLTGKADACIATIKSNASPGNTLPGISGQRAYFRNDLLPYIEDFRPLGYGIEQFLGKALSHLNTTKVSLPAVSYISKREKRGNVQGLYEHAKMWPEVFAGSIRKNGKKKLDIAKAD
jgi:hypothetical protein